MIKVSIVGVPSMARRPVEVSVFKGGEVNVKLPEDFAKYLQHDLAAGYDVGVWVTAHITNSDLAMAFFMTVDAIRRECPTARITATLPYLPYARQDRVCNRGEALSIAMFARLLNSLDLAMVELIDPHSDVAAAAISRSVVTTAQRTITKILDNRVLSLATNDLLLVAPDAGAVKKTKALSNYLSLPFITASKTRDLATMEITGTQFDGDVRGKNLLVVDDICDGGRTFIQLGEKLREAGCNELSLYVTHGIFSYGIDKLLEIYDRIYTTDSFHPDPQSEFRKYTETLVNARQLRRVHWEPI